MDNGIKLNINNLKSLIIKTIYLTEPIIEHNGLTVHPLSGKRQITKRKLLYYYTNVLFDLVNNDNITSQITQNEIVWRKVAEVWKNVIDGIDLHNGAIKFKIQKEEFVSTIEFVDNYINKLK